VLGVEILDAGHPRAPWQVVERRVSFAQRYGMLFWNVGKKFAEAPDSALVQSVAGRAPVEPESLQRRRIEGRRVDGPAGEKAFEQVAAGGAAEILSGGIGRGATSDAAQAGDHGGGLYGRQGLWSGYERRLETLAHRHDTARPLNPN
jgi:hypothetical protein